MVWKQVGSARPILQKWCESDLGTSISMVYPQKECHVDLSDLPLIDKLHRKLIKWNVYLRKKKTQPHCNWRAGGQSIPKKKYESQPGSQVIKLNFPILIISQTGTKIINNVWPEPAAYGYTAKQCSWDSSLQDFTTIPEKCVFAKLCHPR